MFKSFFLCIKYSFFAFLFLSFDYSFGMFQEFSTSLRPSLNPEGVLRGFQAEELARRFALFENVVSTLGNQTNERIVLSKLVFGIAFGPNEAFLKWQKFVQESFSGNQADALKWVQETCPSQNIVQLRPFNLFRPYYPVCCGSLTDPVDPAIIALVTGQKEVAFQLARLGYGGCLVFLQNQALRRQPIHTGSELAVEEYNNKEFLENMQKNMVTCARNYNLLNQNGIKALRVWFLMQERFKQAFPQHISYDIRDYHGFSMQNMLSQEDVLINRSYALSQLQRVRQMPCQIQGLAVTSL